MRNLPIILSVLLFACKEPSIAPSKATNFNTNFKPAYFADSARGQKLAAGFATADSVFQKFAVDNHLPGLALGIVLDGKLVHSFNYGYADIAKQEPVSSTTMFRIASMSKSITAMAILKLRDEGKLNLDDPASKHIPALKIQTYPTTDAPEITIRHLLTHGAGFPEDNPWGDRQLADTDKELSEFLQKKISFSNTANTNYEYSNLGFALLGKIVTVVAGRQYQDYIREKIFSPLGMSYTGYEYSKMPADKLAHGYRWLNEKWNEEELLHDQPDGSWGAMGSAISSVEEFAKYMAVHLNAWPASNAADTQVLKRSSVREMHHPWRFNGMNLNYRYPDGRACAVSTAYCYGLGWLRDCEDRTIISHSGGLPGFGSYWAILPDYGIGIVALANKTYSGVGRVSNMMLDSLVKIAGLKPRVLPPSQILEQRKNELVKLLPDWNNAQNSGIFAENFFPDNPVDSLIKYSRNYFADAGKIISVDPMVAENQLRGSFLINGEKLNIEVYFTLSPENPALVQAFQIRPVPKK